MTIHGKSGWGCGFPMIRLAPRLPRSRSRPSRLSASYRCLRANTRRPPDSVACHLRLWQRIVRKEFPHLRARFVRLEHHVFGIEVTIVWPAMRHASDRAEVYLHTLATALVRDAGGRPLVGQ